MQQQTIINSLHHSLGVVIPIILPSSVDNSLLNILVFEDKGLCVCVCVCVLSASYPF